MHLGISYNLYDGYEMLESSIKTIKPSVDFINVMFQRVSNHSERMEDDEFNDVVSLLKRLRGDGLIDTASVYYPCVSNLPWINEMQKRQRGYDNCKEHGCTHYISMDVDEFYNPVEIDRVKSNMEGGEYDASVCSLIDYYGDMNHHYPKYSGTSVPFMYTILDDRYFRSGAINRFGILCDPTRQMVSNNVKIFDPETEVVMHHGTMVRKDSESIRRKLENSSAKCNFNKDVINKMVDYYDKWEDGDKKFGAHIKHSPQMVPSIDHIPLEYIDNNWISS